MITKFKALSGLHGLDKLEWLSDDLTAHSLIYGWNGTGKTTLSNILYCLENKSLCVDDFESVEFKLETQNLGTLSQNNIVTNTLKVRVFNEQYIITNVHFDGTGSNPIIMIGDSNIKLLKEIKKDGEELDKKGKELQALEDDQKKAVDTEEILTGAARKWRQIATDLNVTGDTYFGSVFKINQVRDLLSTKKITSTNIDSLSIDAQTEVDARNAIKSDWKVLEFEPNIDLDLTSMFESSNKILSKHISVKKLADIEKLEKPVQDWVKEGLAFHKESDHCAFCSNAISHERFEDLAAQFTDLLTETHNEIDALIQEIDELSLNSPELDSSLLMPAEQKVYSENKTIIDTASSSLTKALKELRAVLLDKKVNITNKDKKYDAVKYPLNIVTSYNASMHELSNSIQRNNALVNNIEEENQSNLSLLMLDCIAKELLKEKYFNNLEINSELGTKVAALKESIEKDSTSLELKKNKINDQKKAVESINGLLSNFFDNKKIHFKPIEIEGVTSYQIIRNGRIAKNLSEGEKSVLALAHFLVSLASSDSNELKDTTVIIDDPVDSQDSNFLFRTYGIIKRCTKDARQLVVMTHNYEFFNLVRDWFSNTAGINKSLLLIERNNGSEGEEIKINNLPALLADYKTEYHYLFSKLYGFVYKNEPIDSPLIANIARKTLEYFSSFKWCCKDSVDFGNRIQSKFLKDDSTPEQRAIGDAIYKFVNEYSHALDPFRPVNITDAEARDTATNTLKFIKESDPEHYKVLKKQCDKHYETTT